MQSWTWQVEYGSSAYWLGVGLLAVAVLVLLIWGYREWQELREDEEPDSPDDLLDAFRIAHARGELDDEEFRRVQQRLSTPPASPEPVVAKPGDRAGSAVGEAERRSGLNESDQPPGAGATEHGAEPAPASEDRSPGPDRM
jgi:hypothetical protein